jgi:hypothetical protein
LRRPVELAAKADNWLPVMNVCFRGKRTSRRLVVTAPNNSMRALQQCQIGCLKYTHHFGLNRFATSGEQLILQEFVTHSINRSLPPLGSVLGAAALAAGDKLGGTTCFGSQNPPLPLIVARHCSMVTKPQFVPPSFSTAHHLYESAKAVPTAKNIDAAATTTALKGVLRTIGILAQVRLINIRPKRMCSMRD